jgi:signal transduction histidine kinase
LETGDAGFSVLKGVPANQVLRDVRAAQVSAVFRQMPIALAVNLLNAAITVIVLQQLAAATVPFAWLCLVTLVTAGRWVLWQRYRRAHPKVEDAPHWSLLASCGSLIAGLCWGLGGVVMFPVVPVIGQIFLTFVIGGMCAGGVVLNASHLPALLAFLLSASLPMAVRFLCEDTVTGSALGAMILVFAAALSLAGGHLNRIFTETMRLRIELNEANLRLRAEIAERQATEAVLRQAQKLEAVGQLTGGIAHDFNNLLTVVIGNLILAIGRVSENSTVVPLLEGALEAAERGVSLIQRLLAFARKQRLDPRSVDLGRLVANIEELLQRTLGGGIRLAIARAADVGPASVDANQLELAILNLTINARDAMPAGGALRIGLENRRADRGSPHQLTPGDYVVISISDSGTGMDEATLARAFDPFFTTKEIGSGSGLGLPMVQGFAAQSGGAVQIRSRPGEGTTVELWLPRALEPPSEAVGGDQSPLVMPQDAQHPIL